MRFLLLPIAVLAVASGSVAVQPTPRPLVILVHGRGHLDGDSAELRRFWKRDLDSSLASVGLPRLSDSDVRLAWYADALDPHTTTACVARAPADSLDLGGLARDFLASLALALPRNESREARILIGDLLYVADESRRCVASRRVAAAIDAAAASGRPAILVAYSLGSLVAYDALRSRSGNAAGSPAIHFVTIGSPLGNPDIRELLGHGADSLRAPVGVASWENIYDPNDAFAAPLGAHVIGRVARDRITHSAAEDAHHIGRYLRDRATGVAVGRALCAFMSAPTRECAGLEKN